MPPKIAWPATVVLSVAVSAERFDAAVAVSVPDTVPAVAAVVSEARKLEAAVRMASSPLVVALSCVATVPLLLVNACRALFCWLSER